jgi:hypothetical protein
MMTGGYPQNGISLMIGLNAFFTLNLLSSDKIAAMRKSSIVITILGLLITAGLLYQIPAMHNRLSWRLDFALAYLRGIVNPVKALPTAIAEDQEIVDTNPSPTPITKYTSPNTPEVENTTIPEPTLTPIPEAVSLPAPEWERQDINNCGPASLAMYLRYYGWEGDQKTITDLIKPFREDRNVNVEELVYYVRNHAGWLRTEYRVGGNLELLKAFISIGIPVMIEESFYFDDPYWINDDLWAAHYNLITGYDDIAQIFTGQDSFHGADRKIPYQELDEYWQSFNRVYILIYPPDKDAQVQVILGDNWDIDVNRQNALEIALRETQADSGNAFAWFNQGSNLTYFERYIEATDAFDKAREIGLPQRMLRYQFSPFIAYFHTGQMDDLINLTEYALEITPNSEEAWLWHGWAMYRSGDIQQARQDFERAYQENPNYQDAIYALDFLRDNP